MPTRKKTEEPAEDTEPQICVNGCGPAKFRTTNPGQVPIELCEYCASRIYPGHAGLEPIE